MKTALNRPIRHLFASIVALGLSFASTSSAATLDFTAPGSTVYASHFQQLSTGTFFSQQNGYVQGQQNSAFRGSTLYNTNPHVFGEASISLDAAITGPLSNSPALILFSRMNDEGVGFAARVLLVSATNLRIILSYETSGTTFSAGHVLLDWEYNVFAGGAGFYRTGDNMSGASGTTGHTLTSGALYGLSLESTASDEFLFEVRNASGQLIASSGLQTSAGLQAAIDPAGRVGFGGFAANSAGNTLRFYEFTVIPEPSTYALLAGSGVFLIGAFRAKRRLRRGATRRPGQVGGMP